MVGVDSKSPPSVQKYCPIEDYFELSGIWNEIDGFPVQILSTILDTPTVYLSIFLASHLQKGFLSDPSYKIQLSVVAAFSSVVT